MHGPGFDSLRLHNTIAMVSKKDILDNKEKLLSKMVTDPNSDCTLISGYKDKDGYVQFQFRSDGEKKNIQAHRAVYISEHNVELSSEDVIMHTCDNPSCVNSSHLKLGTHYENVEDRVSKGRSAVQDANGRYVHGRYCK
jgi:hypothetical protein